MAAAMKLKFKHQQFQEEAARAVVECFKGQPNRKSLFTLERGKVNKDKNKQTTLQFNDQSGVDLEVTTGFKNNKVEVLPETVLENIKRVQVQNGLKVSEQLEGYYNLTIEMETGTGKTYTYIKTMFELNKHYGWNKFIIVVPSVAIREGVKKSFEITEDHFMEQYGQKVRYFVYNSKQLHNIDRFASDPGINVMIINSQAFNARGKDARRIYMELDEFQTRKPIDVIAQTNPILIIDEPQSVEGKKTKESLKLFNPLFTLRYSATHKEEHNKIYRLDALDAYNKKLVKKIYVKGVSIKGSTATDGYLYLEDIELSTRKPVARLEFEIKTNSGVRKTLRKVEGGFSLYEHSGLEQYKGYTVAEINGATNTIHFTNGVTLTAGEAIGDVNELALRRIQIRETIKSHFEKERKLFKRGIKVISLFFIDEVAKYRQYDTAGNQVNGEYAQIFEEEYLAILNEYLSLFVHEDEYCQYLNNIKVSKTHNGYFSIDKHGKMVDPKLNKTETDSQDVDAYDLIMRDKERLLSFSEPTRFIFSHSALKEGWDNPNVFQICTLKHSDSTIKKRQEVGRGLRLCVNQNGERIDATIPGLEVHDINVLTVVASESYESFAKGLQSEIAETLSDRPRKAGIDFFLDKLITNGKGEKLSINDSLARKLHNTFIRNYYLDDDDNLTEVYFDALAKAEVQLPPELADYQQSIIDLVSTIYSDKNSSIISDERKLKDLELNKNFKKQEFQELWKKINVKTAYTVDFDTKELINNCIIALDSGLKIAEIIYQVRAGEVDVKSKEELATGSNLQLKETSAGKIKAAVNSNIKYDLIGKLVDATQLTRKTIVSILTGVKAKTFYQFRINPEDFILKTAQIINEQKATAIIDKITYDVLNDTYDNEIFTKSKVDPSITLPVVKHIYDYVITDSNIEKTFAKELDASTEVSVYAKLPRGFFIPTPMGNYNPDWAIVFNEGKVKHIYFIAETKGSLNSLDISGIEKAKIACARKHFKAISNCTVKYDVVNSYQKLIELVK